MKRKIVAFVISAAMVLGINQLAMADEASIHYEGIGRYVDLTEGVFQEDLLVEASRRGNQMTGEAVASNGDLIKFWGDVTGPDVTISVNGDEGTAYYGFQTEDNEINLYTKFELSGQSYALEVTLQPVAADIHLYHGEGYYVNVEDGLFENDICVYATRTGDQIVGEAVASNGDLIKFWGDVNSGDLNVSINGALATVFYGMKVQEDQIECNTKFSVEDRQYGFEVILNINS